MKEKRMHIMLLVLGIFFLTIGLCLALFTEKPENANTITVKEMEENTDKIVHEQEVVNKELEEMLQAFAEIMYSYDTRERNFYEGTEEYLTAQAYQQLVPFREEDLEDSKDAVAEKIEVVSNLENSLYYSRILSEMQVEVIMESVFTLSASKNGNVVQYLKLSVESREGQWKITDICVLYTEEQ